MAVTNIQIYNNALAHIGERVTSVFTGDYVERAPYLLASFCSLAKNIDKKIRKAEKLGDQPKFSPVLLGINEDFPLCEQLCTAASYYLASMLAIDEDPELSENLYDKYCDCIATVGAMYDISEPASCGSITEKYFSF